MGNYLRAKNTSDVLDLNITEIVILIKLLGALGQDVAILDDTAILDVPEEHTKTWAAALRASMSDLMVIKEPVSGFEDGYREKILPSAAVDRSTLLPKSKVLPISGHYLRFVENFADFLDRCGGFSW